MNELFTTAVMGFLVLLASIISVEVGISVALIEIFLGVVAGNLGIKVLPWVSFLGTFAGVVLTFLAGAEVDIPLLRAKFKESALIGGLSFLFPFVLTFLFAWFIAGWDLRASEIAGIALSTTSLAVVYAVLVETGLNRTQIGKLIMAATFITDLATVLALSILFVQVNAFTTVFMLVSIALIIILPKISPWFFKRYGERVIEPEIKLMFFVLFLLMYLGDLGLSHAVLPAFILGLVLSQLYEKNKLQLQRMRVVGFALLTPFFFLKAGMNISISVLIANLSLLAAFFVVKIAAKFVGVLPVSRRYIPESATYTTLLMSTGLTFGTISSIYGLNAGIINKAQFSILVAVVIASAIIPTIIAQRFFSPKIGFEE